MSEATSANAETVDEYEIVEGHTFANVVQCQQWHE